MSYKLLHIFICTFLCLNNPWYFSREKKKRERLFSLASFAKRSSRAILRDSCSLRTCTTPFRYLFIHTFVSLVGRQRWSRSECKRSAWRVRGWIGGQLAFVRRKDSERTPRCHRTVRPVRTGRGRVRVRVHARTHARGRDNSPV